MENIFKHDVPSHDSIVAISQHTRDMVLYWQELDNIESYVRSQDVSEVEYSNDDSRYMSRSPNDYSGYESPT